MGVKRTIADGGWEAIAVTLASLLVLSLVAAAFIHAASGGVEDSAGSPQALFDEMSTDEKEALLIDVQRFNRMPSAEQRRLRELHAAIRADPRADLLSRVMDRYHLWLMTLPSVQRIELLQLTADERIERIALIRHRERRRRITERSFDADDREIVLGWMNGLIRRRENELLARLPPEVRRRARRLEPAQRRRLIAQATRRRVPLDRSLVERLQISDADLTWLASQLSSDARQVLENAREQGELQALLRRWILVAF